jgi:SAM-dependent methyltransferase
VFKEEAEWINKALSVLQPDKNGNLIGNLGSSTYFFRTKIQPHIHSLIVEPLEKNNWRLLHIDIKKEDGVDMVADLTKEGFAEAYKNFFTITLCTNMLEHVESISDVVKHLIAVTRNGGYLLITVPYKYQLHFDPIDNGFRPKPKEIVSLFKNSAHLLSSAIITITDKKYYPVKKSKYPLWGHRERIKYFFGIKHKVSCVLLQVAKAS